MGVPVGFEVFFFFYLFLGLFCWGLGLKGFTAEEVWAVGVRVSGVRHLAFGLSELSGLLGR